MEGTTEKPILYYHFASFYSQKALMFLHEKKIDFKLHLINMPAKEGQKPWFLKINPLGEVPVLKDGIKAIPDSDKILEYIQDNFQNGDHPDLIHGSTPEEEEKVKHFLEVFGELEIDAITYGVAFHPHIRANNKWPFREPIIKGMRNFMLNRSTVLRQRALENPFAAEALNAKADRHDTRLKLFTDESENRKLLAHMERVLDEVERELAGRKKGEFLVSDWFSAADCVLSVILNRLAFLGYEEFWAKDKRPNIAEYFEVVKQRESFKKSTSTPNLPLMMIAHMYNNVVPKGFFPFVMLGAIVVGGAYAWKKWGQ